MFTVTRKSATTKIIKPATGGKVFFNFFKS